MKAKLRTRQKTAGGHSPRTPRGETPQGGKQHTGKPTRQQSGRGLHHRWARGALLLAGHEKDGKKMVARESGYFCFAG